MLISIWNTAELQQPSLKGEICKLQPYLLHFCVLVIVTFNTHKTCQCSEYCYIELEQIYLCHTHVPILMWLEGRFWVVFFWLNGTGYKLNNSWHGTGLCIISHYLTGQPESTVERLVCWQLCPFSPQLLENTKQISVSILQCVLLQIVFFFGFCCQLQRLPVNVTKNSIKPSSGINWKKLHWCQQE